MRAEAGESGAIYFTSAGAARRSDAVRGTGASDVQFASPICVLSVQLVSTSNYVAAAGLVSAISSPRHLQMKHRGVGRRHFSRVTGGGESFDLMLSANTPALCPAATLVRSSRWPNSLAIPLAISLAISWAFPALYSIIWPGRKPARLALTCLPPRTRTLDLSRGFAGAASLLPEIFGV